MGTARRQPVAVVRGSGDVGSAVAHLLFTRRFHVLLHDEPCPAHTRRGMAFTDAAFGRKVDLAGVLGKNPGSVQGVREMLECGRALPVTVIDLDALLAAVAPSILIDARMRKRARPEPQRRFAGLTVGLGPGFVAGEHTDVVIETAWGEALGQAIRRGAAQPLAGEPRPLGGFGRERYVYAPVAGVFLTVCTIGMRVAAGDIVANVGDAVLRAPLSGYLRGLTHSGVTVPAGAKVIEIDPRDTGAGVFGIGERPLRIAEGVLAAITN